LVCPPTSFPRWGQEKLVEMSGGGFAQPSLFEHLILEFGSKFRNVICISIKMQFNFYSFILRTLLIFSSTVNIWQIIIGNEHKMQLSYTV
jgi:hypothetical protein